MYSDLVFDAVAVIFLNDRSVTKPTQSKLIDLPVKSLHAEPRAELLALYADSSQSYLLWTFTFVNVLHCNFRTHARHGISQHMLFVAPANLWSTLLESDEIVYWTRALLWRMSCRIDQTFSSSMRAIFWPVSSAQDVRSANSVAKLWTIGAIADYSGPRWVDGRHVDSMWSNKQTLGLLFAWTIHGERSSLFRDLVAWMKIRLLLHEPCFIFVEAQNDPVITLDRSGDIRAFFHYPENDFT